jgi:predicted transcriptional regulator
MNILTLELTDTQAEALAQFVKRVGWQEWRQNAVDDNEASQMRGAFDQLQKALREAGFSPR